MNADKKTLPNKVKESFNGIELYIKMLISWCL